MTIRDAVESRCIPYNLIATGRKDVPPQLSDDFYRATLSIRKKALMWRMRNLDFISPETEYIARISRRMNQIILPLLTLAEQMSEPTRDRYRTELLEFVGRIDQQAKEIASEDIDAAVIRALLHLQRDEPSIKDIRDAVIKTDGENFSHIEKWLTPKKVGQIVRTLGFQTKHRGSGFVVLIEREKLRRQAEKYGIDSALLLNSRLGASMTTATKFVSSI